MEELVALIFTFCTSTTVIPNQNDTDTIIACNTYVTNCVIDKKSGWDRKNLSRCEQEGIRTKWRTYSEAE